ncbi:MAG: hypothetical protein ABOK23_02985 [Candidatus Methanoperedens sp.]|nr:hypothetical protein [Candidatus Methanoperedens sp.]MCZ7394810.1 hypothetical protein [Candidatus Methanoperedens sp.]
MNTCKISLVNKSMMGLLIWLVLITGLVAAQTSSGAGRLTLTLQPGLDGNGSIKATSIAKAELSNPDGTLVRTATIIGGKAQFDLSGVAPGDYFIRVNDLADDLVPTRIDDPSTAISQSVGQKLRVSEIDNNLSDPTYKIMTFSRGQGAPPVVGYSDGATLTPERYAYVILSLKTSPQKLEFRILGSAAQINSYTPTMPNHPSTLNPPFSTWMMGESNHASNYNGTDSNCNTCHVNLDTKPATFSDVSITNGWCFRCHYGKGGLYRFIDTTVISTPVPTTVIPTPIATTVVPTATPGTPAFEAFLAISALLVAILVRRR